MAKDYSILVDPRYKKTLEKEAPETLRSPKRGEFNTEKNYAAAKSRYENVGNWATGTTNRNLPVPRIGKRNIRDTMVKTEAARRMKRK